MAPLHRSLRLSAAVALFLGACADPTADSTMPANAKPGGGSGDPTVTAADPISAPADTTIEVKVFGTNFDQGSAVAFLRSGAVDPQLVVNSTSYRSTSELRANVTITPTALEGLRDIQVTTSGGKKGIGAEKFQVEIAYDALAGWGTGVSVWSKPVSPNGLIAGMIYGLGCGGEAAPVIWDRAKLATTLPDLPGTCGSRVNSVNSAGVAAGTGKVGSVWAMDLRWIPTAGGYQPEQLPLLPDGKFAGAIAINEAGQIISANYAAVWTEGAGWVVLPWAAGATVCRTAAQNDAGMFAGHCVISGFGRPVAWSSASAAPTLLPMPSGGTSGNARSINNSGVIVGYAQVATRKGSGVYQAIMWTPFGSGWTMAALPDLGAGGSAVSLNDAGQVVGVVGSRPAYWQGGVLRVLETDNGAGEARGISEPAGGLIIGGTIMSGGGGGQSRAVRWMP
jgi:uncharacterized membrane protein